MIYYYIRSEVAEKIFESDYEKSGIHIKVARGQYNELFDIEGSKMNPNTDRDDELAEKIIEVMKYNKNKGTNR